MLCQIEMNQIEVRKSVAEVNQNALDLELRFETQVLC